MSFKRKQSNKDSNHSPIVETLQKCGWWVKDVSIVPNFVDLILVKRPTTIWFADAKGDWDKIRVSQIEAWLDVEGCVVILTSVDDALAFSKQFGGFKYALTAFEQRMALRKECDRVKEVSKAKNPSIPITRFLKILEENK